MPINPNAARDWVNSYPSKSAEEKARMYPLFFNKVKLDLFRHVRNLEMRFIHPITVISGSNRSGKTSVLMTIACSHYNFDRKDVANGTWRRATWSHLVRFTNHDDQTVDWEYHIKYSEGRRAREARGYRKHITQKWGGAGKKESQIGKPTDGHPNGGRHVCLIDLNRINPGRHLTSSVYNKARRAEAEAIANQEDINTYLSYILETDYLIDKLAESADNNVYKFCAGGNCNYSSFNTASGEDVLVNLLEQVLHMPVKSLILIDELEVGLHPKIQRRLMDVLFVISKKQYKQFIISSHSYAVIDSVPQESRLFIHNNGGRYEAMAGLSTYETLTRMDSEAFPVCMVYVEDEESKKIVDYAISELNATNQGFARLVKTIVVGPANDTYSYFKTRQRLSDAEPLFSKAACVLDGDMKDIRDRKGNIVFPPEPHLFFHYSNVAPEKMLVKSYLAVHPNDNIQYHVDNSNPHCLLEKMVEQGIVVDKQNAFNLCFNEYKNSAGGNAHFEDLKLFLINLI